MSHPVTSHGVGRLVCEALGIDPKRVSRLVITLEASDVVRVEVDRLPTEEEIRAACAVLQQHRDALQIVNHSQALVEVTSLSSPSRTFITLREPGGG